MSEEKNKAPNANEPFTEEPGEGKRIAEKKYNLVELVKSIQRYEDEEGVMRSRTSYKPGKVLKKGIPLLPLHAAELNKQKKNTLTEYILAK